MTALIRASAIAPLALIALLAALFLTLRPLDFMSRGAPPAEELTVERVSLDRQGIHVAVRSGAASPLTVAQVQVDGAYWEFTQTPAGPLSYLGSARIDIPYRWVAGEAHHLTFLTATGATFAHEIEVAVATPETGAADILGLAMVGLFVGIVPILIGYAFMPAIASFGAAGRQFALALTVGLLTFLLIDTLNEGLEIAGRAVGGQKAATALWLGALVGFLGLIAVGRRGGRPPEGAALAAFIAIGIGLHNLGEGLAIGASLAGGAVALASFLVFGFALHNVTEGIAIAAPIERPARRLSLLFGLALVAGGPAIFGTVAGAYAFSPFWAALAFGVGAGAILQVVVEVGLSLTRGAPEGGAWVSGASLSGFAAGVGIMYATGVWVGG
jgi:zinc transporter ZupT